MALSHPYEPSLISIHDYWKKNIVLTIWSFVSKGISLLFNILSRFVIAFLPRSKHHLLSWLLSPSAVILEPKKRKLVTASICPLSICHEVMRPDAMILVFWMLSFMPAFSLSLLPTSRGSLVPLYFLSLEWYHLHIWSCWHFSWKAWFYLATNPAWHFTWCTLYIRLKKWGIANKQPWQSPFPILNQLLVPCKVLIVASWPAYRFLRRQVRWSDILFSWRIFHSLLWSTQLKASV